MISYPFLYIEEQTNTGQKCSTDIDCIVNNGNGLWLDRIQIPEKESRTQKSAWHDSKRK